MKNQIIMLLLAFACSMPLSADQQSRDARLYPTAKTLLEDACADSSDTVSVRFRGYEISSVPCEGVEISESVSENRSIPEGFGVDLLVEPLLWFQFGRFSDPIESSVGIMPRVRFQLWRGGLLDLRSNITFRDELNDQAGYHGGLYLFSQTIRAGNNNWITGSGGVFTSDRWGIDAHWMGTFAAKRLFPELQLGVTGYSHFDDSLFLFSRFDRFTSVARIGWYVPSVDLMIQAEGGRYLLKDWGGGGTLTRDFGTVSMAITGLYTPRGVNGGFSLTVPLWAGEHPHVGRVRYGLGDSYRFRYRFKGYQPPAHLYETGSDFMDKVVGYR